MDRGAWLSAVHGITKSQTWRGMHGTAVFQTLFPAFGRKFGHNWSDSAGKHTRWEGGRTTCYAGPPLQQVLSKKECCQRRRPKYMYHSRLFWEGVRACGHLSACVCMHVPSSALLLWGLGMVFSQGQEYNCEWVCVTKSVYAREWERTEPGL